MTRAEWYESVAVRPCGSAGPTPSSRGGKRPRLSISVGEGTIEIGDLFISSNSPSGGMSTRRTPRGCQASLPLALLPGSEELLCHSPIAATGIAVFGSQYPAYTKSSGVVMSCSRNGTNLFKISMISIQNIERCASASLVAWGITAIIATYTRQASEGPTAFVGPLA